MSKVEVTRTLPEALISAVEKLPLSRIMKGKCYKLLFIVIKKGVQDGKSFNEYIPLAKTYFEKAFGKKFNKQFFNLLRDSGILERNKTYHKGKAYGYRIRFSLLESKWVTVKYMEKYKDEIDVRDCILFQGNLPCDENAIKYFQGHLNPNIHRDISPVSSVPFFSHVYSSLLLPISASFFSIDIVYDDLRSLHYDTDKIIEYFIERTSAPEKLGLVVNEDITTPIFEVYSPNLNFRWYTKLDNGLAKAREYGYDLIKDGDKYFLTTLEEYFEKKKLNTKIYARWLLSGFITGSFYASRNKTNNRLDHNLTAASKEVTRIIMADNDLIEIDLRNSQFAIHSLWLKSLGLHVVYEDVHNYCSACAKGELYEFIAEHLKTTRAVAKTAMMSLSFSSKRNSSPEKKILRQLFPNVVDHADQYKKKAEKTSSFSIMLQRLESAIIIDQVYSELKLKGIFCITKHDSVIVRRSQKDIALDIIGSIFKKIGLNCTLSMGDVKIFTG